MAGEALIVTNSDGKVLLTTSGDNVSLTVTGNASIVGTNTGDSASNIIAWAKFAGGATPVIAASHNITSIVRSAAGLYTVTMTTAATDANYAVVGSAGNHTDGTIFVVGTNASTAPSTTVFKLSIMDLTTTAADPSDISITVVR